MAKVSILKATYFKAVGHLASHRLKLEQSTSKDPKSLPRYSFHTEGVIETYRRSETRNGP